MFNMRSSPDNSDLVNSDLSLISPAASASRSCAPKRDDLGFRFGQTPSIRPGKTTKSNSRPISPDGVKRETYSPDKSFRAKESSGTSLASWSKTKSMGFFVGLRSVNLAAAANNVMSESRFLPACIESSETPLDATTQRSSNLVSETRFHSTASVVASGSLASLRVSPISFRNLSTFLASGDLIKETKLESVNTSSKRSSVVASDSGCAFRKDLFRRTKPKPSSPQTSDTSSCSAWARVSFRSDKQTAASLSNSPAACSDFSAAAVPVTRTGTE